MTAADRPLAIWAVSDGRAGIEAQALGLAEAVSRLRPAEIAVKRIGWRWGLGRLPWRLNIAGRFALRADGAIAEPWPDIWIAAGRATLPLSMAVRRWSQGRTFAVQAQHPRASIRRFDLVVPPQHDRLAGDNVFPILGSPSRITPRRIAEAREALPPDIRALPRPRVAVAVGGASRAFDLPAGHAAGLAERIAEAVGRAGGSVLVTFTRRTPAGARAAVSARLAHLPGRVWDDSGDNPYLTFLAAADCVLVTEDSVNLATDAAATGRPVHVLDMPVRRASSARKFRDFHESLRRQGVARPFAGRFEAWDYPPLAEADRAAAELLRRFDRRIVAERR